MSREGKSTQWMLLVGKSQQGREKNGCTMLNDFSHMLHYKGGDLMGGR